MTFHVVRPRRYCFCIRFPRGFCFWQFFCSPGGNPWFEHTSVIIHNIIAYSALSLSTTPICGNEEWGWFSQIIHKNLPSRFHACFLFCLPFWYRPQTQIRIVLMFGWQINISSSTLSPNRVPIELSQIAFPITVLPKDDHTDFAQEERLGLPYWTMIFAICVVVDESICLDIPIWECSMIWEHVPILPGCKQILRPLLVHRNPAIQRWYPWFLPLSFVMLMILVQWILHKIRLDLPYWSMIWDNCALVDVSKYLGIQTLDFSMTLVHLPFWPAYKRILAGTSWKSGFHVHDFCGCHLGRRNMFYNVTSEYGSTFIFLKFWFQLRIPKMTQIHQWRDMNFSSLIPCFIDHLFLGSDFRQLPCRNFSPVFPFFYFCCLCLWNFHCLRHRNEFVNKTVMIHRIHPFFSDVILVMFVYF